VLFGTGNDRHSLPNDANNRRFVVIEIFGGKSKVGPIEAYLDMWRNYLFGQAMQMYRAGKRANLPRELFKLQTKINEESQSMNDTLAACIDDILWEPGT